MEKGLGLIIYSGPAFVDFFIVCLAQIGRTPRHIFPYMAVGVLARPGFKWSKEFYFPGTTNTQKWSCFGGGADVDRAKTIGQLKRQMLLSSSSNSANVSIKQCCSSSGISRSSSGTATTTSTSSRVSTLI